MISAFLESIDSISQKNFKFSTSKKIQFSDELKSKLLSYHFHSLNSFDFSEKINFLEEKKSTVILYKVISLYEKTIIGQKNLDFSQLWKTSIRPSQKL